LAYLDNRPAESFASFEKQVFTIVNSQTAYTLSHSVTNENDIRLVVNSVVQEPGSGKAYTASGTTLTLSAALTNGTDTMYCVFLGRALQTVNPPNASVGTSQLNSSLDFSSKTITLADSMKATPAFSAYINTASFQFAENSWTKLQMYGEDFDTDSAYDTSNAKFTIPTGAAGKYNFNIQVRSINNHTIRIIIALYKNGSAYVQEEIRVADGSGTSFPSLNLSSSLDCAVGDYFEAYAYHTNTGGDNGFQGSAASTDARKTYWSASKLIGV
jgi:hypothetical protein